LTTGNTFQTKNSNLSITTIHVLLSSVLRRILQDKWARLKKSPSETHLYSSRGKCSRRSQTGGGNAEKFSNDKKSSHNYVSKCELV